MKEAVAVAKQPPVTLGVEKLASRQEPLTNLDPPRRYTARSGSSQAGFQDKVRCLGIAQRSI